MIPIVSVLMSVYNGEKFLVEAVESIISQSFEKFEFVIVNDGSRDSSEIILSSYKDPRIKVIKTHENNGLSASLNLGLIHCEADLIVRMDADDVAYPQRLGILLEDWEIAGRPDVFGSGVDCINEEGKQLWSIDMPRDGSTIKTELLAIDGKMALIHPTVLFRKETVLAVGGYDTYFKNGEDYDLWLRMANQHTFGNSPRRLLKYRFQGQSITALSTLSDSGELKFGSWTKLLSHQKMLLIERGKEFYWHQYQTVIISELKKRANISEMRTEATLGRRMTDAKILFYSGKKMRGIVLLLLLFLRYPGLVASRITGIRKIHLRDYLISNNDLEKVLNSLGEFESQLIVNEIENNFSQT